MAESQTNFPAMNAIRNLWGQLLLCGRRSWDNRRLSSSAGPTPPNVSPIGERDATAA